MHEVIKIEKKKKKKTYKQTIKTRNNNLVLVVVKWHFFLHSIILSRTCMNIVFLILYSFPTVLDQGRFFRLLQTSS